VKAELKKCKQKKITKCKLGNDVKERSYEKMRKVFHEKKEKETKKEKKYRIYEGKIESLEMHI
jgi:hypothetical protein